MSFAISHFPDSFPIRDAMQLAEKNPKIITAWEYSEMSQNPVTKEWEIYANIFAIGRYCRFPSNASSSALTVHCHTFFSLGKIKHGALKVFADHVILVNEVCSQGFIEFHAKKTFAAVGCKLTGSNIQIFSKTPPWFYEPKPNYFVNQQEHVINENGKKRKVTIYKEEGEDPIDASLRDMRKELDLQEFFDLHTYTKEVAQKMGLTSILV